MAETDTQERAFANRTVRLVVNTETLRGTIVDRGSGEGWRFAPLDHLRATSPAGDDLPCVLISADEVALGAGGVAADVQVGANLYRLVVWLESDAADVIFELQPRDEPARIAAVHFPGPLLPLRGPVTQFVLPQKNTNGIVQYPAYRDHWARTRGEIRLMMPFWGLGGEALDLLCLLETADDMTLAVEDASGGEGE